MKRASDILLKIAQIFGLVMGILLLISFVPMILVACMPEVRDGVIQAMQENGAEFGDDTEYIVTLYQVMIVVYSMLFVYLGIMCIVDAAIARKAMTEPSRGRYIACIVLGAMSIDFSLVGGILGLIALNKENKQKQQE